MFRPVGSQPPSVYWRRRLALLASVLALLGLIALTVRVLASDDSGAPTAAGTTGASSPASPPSSPSTTSAVRSTASGTSSTSKPPSSTSKSSSASTSSSAPPKQCTPSSLGLAAASEKAKYSVGDQPVLSILVTDKATTPCVQDLADSQIVLRVYNGESRVWGSHDCKIEPGTDERTLMGGATVRVSIVWSGLSSQPKCKGTRQRVGAGTYTLFASLAGHEGKAAQFTIG